jgi:spermidine synthase / saccharopine dehydrogenase (NADP+, L-glutamate-forming)
MSALFASPRVKVHIGDGFAFLAKNTSTYDVIITDSSDPVGPAEALFEKPYFQLLHDSLAPGGSISTQGECLWLHLQLIRTLNQMTSGIFPTAEYAYTTIPTYPSGQIGFIVCSKDANRNLKEPLRDVEGCRYYNANVHRSAFILPEFGRLMLENGTDIRHVVGNEAAAEKNAKEAESNKKKILLLGSGFVAKPCAEYVLRDPKNELTVGKFPPFFPIPLY